VHASGALLAPTPDRTVTHAHVARYCATTQLVRYLLYIHGKLDSTPCCTSETCGAHEPGNKTRWPADPKELRALLLRLQERDIKVAKEQGKDVVDDLCNACDLGHYRKAIEAMESLALEPPNDGKGKAKGK
jgi:hypothetical protein